MLCVSFADIIHLERHVCKIKVTEVSNIKVAAQQTNQSSVWKSGPSVEIVYLERKTTEG